MSLQNVADNGPPQLPVINISNTDIASTKKYFFLIEYSLCTCINYLTLNAAKFRKIQINQVVFVDNLILNKLLE